MKSFFSKWYVKLFLWFGTCAGIIVLGIFAVNRMVYSSVFIDANPSVVIKLDKEGFVLGVEGVNDDGKEVVEDLELKGEDAETAVEEVVATILDYGYMDEEQSALLLSIKSRDEEVADELQYDLSFVADDVLGWELDNGIVLDQTITSDSTVRAIASSYHITQGKAYLVWQLCMAEPELQVWDLAELTITDMIRECIDKDIDLPVYVDIIGDALSDFYNDFEEDDDDYYYDDLPAPDWDEDYDDEFEEDDLDEDLLEEDEDDLWDNASVYDTSDIDYEDEEEEEEIEEDIIEEEWIDDPAEEFYDEEFPEDEYYDEGETDGYYDENQDTSDEYFGG